MTIRVKLLLALAIIATIVVMNGLIDAHYASVTRAEIEQLGKVAITGSYATHDMLNTLSKLEMSLSVGDDRDLTPADTLHIRSRGEALFQELHLHLHDARGALLGTNVVNPKVTVSGSNLQMQQMALLNGIESTLDQIETDWVAFTNCLPALPRRAEGIRENQLLPAMNGTLRPALSRYDRFLTEQTGQQVQKILEHAQRSRKMMLEIELLVALITLVAVLFLAKWILDPIREFALVSRQVAAGNRQRRLRLRRTDELGAMAAAFNDMLDALQATTVSRDELERNVKERTAELEREIRARQAANAELRKSEQNLAITLDSIGDGVLVTDAAGKVTRLNPVAEQLTGWKQAEAVGRPVNEVFQILNEQTRQPIIPPIIEARPQDKTLSLSRHTILLHRTGSEYPIADTCAPIRDENDRVVGVVLVFRDVSEERWAKDQIKNVNLELERRVESRTAELRESERRHRTLLANLQGMAYRCRNDRDWSMEFMSEGCRHLLGVEPEALTSGQIIYNELIHPEDRESVWQLVQTAIGERSAFTIEYRVKHADGNWRSVWEQGRAVFGDAGQVTALEGYIIDITARIEAERMHRALEDQLRQAQKLEAVGTLAGGIAHDFNNILAAILGSAELIKMDMPADHPSRECLEQVFVAGNRARELVQQILMFSRRRESERNAVSLQPVVRECLKLLRSTIPAMVEIKHYIDPACAPVLADLTQIHQVIMNLCTNSWQALPKRGGRINVELRMCQIDEAMATMHPDLHAGPYVQLSVMDNGCGMDKATLERIFEPFFTTKPAGKGSGLGLSVVHGIVKRHEGAITVESDPGKGTIFYIYLPAKPGSQPKGPERTPLVLQGNGERILLVDDEEIPGRTTERILNRLKYGVERFNHPKDALARFRSAPDKFDLVVSDLAMPAFSGMDFGAAVRQIRPDVPILLTTGLVDPAIEEQARQVKIYKILLKPVTSEILGREIAQILADRGGI